MLSQTYTVDHFQAKIVQCSGNFKVQKTGSARRKADSFNGGVCAAHYMACIHTKIKAISHSYKVARAPHALICDI